MSILNLEIINELNDVADELDENGLYIEAEQIDGMVKEALDIGGDAIDYASWKVAKRLIDHFFSRGGIKLVQANWESQIAPLISRTPELEASIVKDGGAAVLKDIDKTYGSKWLVKVMSNRLIKIFPKSMKALSEWAAKITGGAGDVVKVAPEVAAKVAPEAVADLGGTGAIGAAPAEILPAVPGAELGIAAPVAEAVVPEVVAGGTEAAVGAAAATLEEGSAALAPETGGLSLIVTGVVGLLFGGYELYKHKAGVKNWLENEATKLLGHFGYSDKKPPTQAAAQQIINNHKDQFDKILAKEQEYVNHWKKLPEAESMMQLALSDIKRVLDPSTTPQKIQEIAASHYLTGITDPKEIVSLLTTKVKEYKQHIQDIESGKVQASSISMFEKFAKKGKKKWSKDKLERADDLASRMMASKDFDGDWPKAFALSRSMENKGYEVKKKPSKPHKKYVPKKKGKKKAAEFLSNLCKFAYVLDDNGLYDEADNFMVVVQEMVSDVELMNDIDML